MHIATQNAESKLKSAGKCTNSAVQAKSKKDINRKTIFLGKRRLKFSPHRGRNRLDSGFGGRLRKVDHTYRWIQQRSMHVRVIFVQCDFCVD